MELLRLAPEEVFPSLSYAPPPASPGAPAWVHAAAARRDQARARLRLVSVSALALIANFCTRTPAARDRAYAVYPYAGLPVGRLSCPGYSRHYLQCQAPGVLCDWPIPTPVLLVTPMWSTHVCGAPVRSIAVPATAVDRCRSMLHLQRAEPLQEGLLVRTPAASPEQQRPKRKATLDGLDSTSFNLVVSTQALLNAQQQQESMTRAAGNGDGTVATPSSTPAARQLQLGDAAGARNASGSQQASDEPATSAAGTADSAVPPSEPAAAATAGTTTPSRASRAQLSREIENDENRAPDGESRRSKILRRISSMRAKFAEAELQMQC